jgi:type IV pilus assembly protein PilY1
MNIKYLFAVLLLLLGAVASNPSRAQITFSEDFTGANTTNSWYFFNGACLTAGSSTATSNPGLIPGCSTVLTSYYSQQTNHDPALTGGYNGFLGATAAPSTPDPIITTNGVTTGYGALRFTNGAPYGHSERGAILSASTFNTGAGIEVTFKTVTYHGDSGGAGGDGADGISFFLMDGSKPPGLGATGGSLAYSCSNNNANYDGLNGGYIGLGIDEFGNFLNGANLVAGYTGTNVATGDNSAYGYGYKPGRIGVRGAGSVSWAALNGAYGTNPSSSILPYYPASLATSCNITGGVYSSATNNCIDICSAGSTYYAAGNVCNKACATGGTYVSGTDTCDSCTSVNGTYNSGTNQCTNTNRCLVGTTYYSGTSTCDSCPATGYATGTYANGQCTNSCPTGSSAPTGTTCMPAGSVYSTGFYCPTGSTIVNNSGTYLCYTALLSYSAGYYCPSGQTIVAGSAVCYTTGLSHGGTFNCPSGQTISGSPYAYCYPSTATSTSAPKYCAVGFTLQGTTLCYPTGLAAASRSATNYCPTGQTITGTSCYPTGNVYGAGFYCPSGSATPTAAGKCCPSGYTYSAGPGACTKSGNPNQAASNATAVTASTAMSASLTMTGSTADSAATAATAATAVTAAQTVTANSTPTQITSPTTAAPQTLAPTTGNTDALYAVQNTCRTGILYNYSSPAAPTSAGPATLANTANTAGILDYAPIPNAYKELTSFQIANEGATTRAAATPIFYDLKITQDGLLSLSYSVGGAYSSLISNQDIKSANGPLPTSFRVGFAGSTGGDTNIHEIMCFKAATAAQSGSSATVNEKQAAKVQAGTQAYFAFYNPTNWTGTVTANTLINNSDGSISINTTANWDASCWLTSSGTPAVGGGCTVPATPGGTPTPTNRIMLTWDTVNNVGIKFEWANLNAAQQAALTAGDATLPPPPNRLNYLRGDRTNEINTTGTGLFRRRDAILGDIVDSSPTWVGPPSSQYTATWQDRLYPTTVMPENAVAQSYVQFQSAEQTRLNVVYVGDNDGFVHGFRAGSFDNNGNFVANGNDGQEVLAYMPGSTLSSAAASGAPGGCVDDTTTGTLVQQIHGVTPAIGTNPLCVQPLLDYSNSQYGHNFFVDATPGSGDLYYGGQWHTWLVGGLGAGGAAIYALDVTNPTAANFTETNASSIVIGEWNAGSIVCAISGAACGNNLGNTYGTPQIKRLHNGNWGVIFGNGFGSKSGDAGIYVMSIDSTSGTATFYYLSITAATGTPAGGNGIAYVSPTDLDGDHITDYVYAGDLAGNVWRFDLTSNNPNNWGVTNSAGASVNAPAPGGGAATPLFTTQSGQPITSQVLAISTLLSGQPRLLIEFGTGQRTQLNNMGPESFASGTQSLYGVWDWNLTNWNAIQPGSAYLSLPATPAATGLTSPYTLSYSNLQAQTLTPNVSTEVNGGPPAAVDGTNVAICWQGSTTCGSGNNAFGWYVNLIGGSPTIPGDAEQVIFNPVFFQGAFVINTIVPANNALATCSTIQDIGYTYALNVTNGGVFTNTFPTFTLNGTVVTDPNEAGVETNATGSVYIVSNPTSNPTSNIIYQTLTGTPGSQEIKIPSNTKAKRITWIEKR